MWKLCWPRRARFRTAAAREERKGGGERGSKPCGQEGGERASHSRNQPGESGRSARAGPLDSSDADRARIRRDARGGSVMAGVERWPTGGLTGEKGEGTGGGTAAPCMPTRRLQTCMSIRFSLPFRPFAGDWHLKFDAGCSQGQSVREKEGGKGAHRRGRDGQTTHEPGQTRGLEQHQPSCSASP